MQSLEWAEFKTKIGTKAVSITGQTTNGSQSTENIQFTKHKIPFLEKYLAYAPKVNPFGIDFEKLKGVLQKENCIAINFDVPNIETSSNEAKSAEILLKEQCVKSPKDTFAKANVILDISQSEEEILAKMHKKHRYNIGYAQRQGVTVRKATSEKDFEIFYKLLAETATRQKYFIHPKKYYQTLWDMFSKKNIAHILIAEHKNKPLTAWMLFAYDGVLYYPYGGSAETDKNLQHSLAVAWEAIKLGKELGCKTFDMWGASEHPNDLSDPWHGFTEFKLKFGGRYVRYIDSYDLIIDKGLYTVFTLANKIRWVILKLLK